MNYLKKLASLLALSAGISFASACKPAGEEGNGNGYDGGWVKIVFCYKV